MIWHTDSSTFSTTWAYQAPHHVIVESPSHRQGNCGRASQTYWHWRVWYRVSLLACTFATSKALISQKFNKVCGNPEEPWLALDLAASTHPREHLRHHGRDAQDVPWCWHPRDAWVVVSRAQYGHFKVSNLKYLGTQPHTNHQLTCRSVMQEYFVTYEPHLMREWKANCLQCRHFWAAGVNDIWAIDQHDKWLCFSLALHTCIEPFSGRILWMKVWHSNCNPQLILSYYIEVVEALQHKCAIWMHPFWADSPTLSDIPMVTQSDPGTENFDIANAQTLLLQMHDPTLEGFVQHRWMRTKKTSSRKLPGHNSDGGSAQASRHFLRQVWMKVGMTPTTPYSCEFCTCLLTLEVIASVNNHRMVFHWVFIPWLQVELNSWKCHDKKKVG